MCTPVKSVSKFDAYNMTHAAMTKWKVGKEEGGPAACLSKWSSNQGDRFHA